MGGKPDWQLEWEAEQRAVLAGVRFSVFAPEGFPVELSSWSGGDGEPVESVGVRHQFGESGSVDVDSEIPEDDFHLRDAQRDAAEELARTGDAVEVRSVSLRVDGVEVPFALAVAGDRWVAVGAVADVTITVRVSGLVPGELSLRALADPRRLVDAAVPEYRPSRAERGVLDPRRVMELAEGTPIADLGATLAGFARGALGLLVSEDPAPSWIGGEPHLPAGMPWPSGVHGPMTFVAQLCLADLDSSVWTGPGSGHLHVFCDVEPESSSIDGAGACAILHTPPGAELGVRRLPDDLHENLRVPEWRVTPRIGLTLPDEDAPIMGPLGLGFGDVRARDTGALWKLKRRLHREQGWHDRAGQLLGWPTWQNDDNMDYLAELRGGQDLEWTLLLQTDALGPELYVVLPTADLADARFDRAEAIIEHD